MQRKENQFVGTFFKMIKRGWRNLIKDPQILFNIKKQTVKFHFEMYAAEPHWIRDTIDLEI